MLLSASVDLLLPFLNDLYLETLYATSPRASFKLQAAEPLPPAVIKQIAKELKDLQEKPEEGIKVCAFPAPLAGWSCVPLALNTWPHRLLFLQLFLSDDNIADVQAEYEGPGELQPEGPAATLQSPGRSCSQHSKLDLLPDHAQVARQVPLT